MPDLHRPKSIARERFDTIYLKLRDRICLIHYEPGTRLGEEDLAREFGVSRTPLRRVLSRLESEGLVESRHGVGTFVTTVDLTSLIETCKFRMELAVMIGKLDPQSRSDADLARIRALLDQCDGLRRQPDARRYAELSMLFFQEIVLIVGNRPLRDIAERLFYLTHRIWLTWVPRLNLSDEIEVLYREMAETLAALEIGDLEAVGHIRRSHISMSVRRMERLTATAC